MLTGYRIAALAVVMLTTLAAGPQAMADFQLTILHFNDMHSRFEPINKFDSGCGAADDAAGKCFGGAARLKSAIDTRRDAITKAGGAVLTLIAGDMFQGSLYYSTYKGQMNAEIMNQMGIDAMALGNHEFDDGPETLVKFAEKAETPLLFANSDLSAAPELAKHILPYVIKQVGGQKVGIIGLTTPDTVEISSPGPTVKFKREEEVLPGLIAELEGQGVNKIIVVTHSGHGRDLEIAAAVPGIDLIVGGHSNTLPPIYPAMVKGPGGKPVPVVQAYAYGKYLGEVTVSFNEGGSVTGAEGRLWVMSGIIPPDPDIADYIKAAAATLENIKSEVVGKTAKEIQGNRKVCRSEVCEMGVLVTDAMLDRVRDQGISIAIQNGGGLRASIDAGEITMGEVLAVLPFMNTLATFQLKGADMIAALENGVSRAGEGAGRFPQVAGLKFQWNPEAKAGSRIVDVQLVDENGNTTPLDPEATYGVVTSNYMRGGGDGYSMFKTTAQNAYDYGPNLEDVVSEYLKAKGTYEPYKDDRITRTK